jgi:hypothetical protein
VKTVDDNLRGIPKEGFLKLSRPDRSTLDPSQRTALIRKGNELFNAGRIEQAKRIFLTTGYGDGLIRIGDYYLKKREPLEALRMYWIAPSPEKAQRILEQAAGVLRNWMHEERGKNEERANTRDEHA